jgi:Phage capsid protein
MGAMSMIPQHFVTEFDTNWQHLLQQKLDKTREYVVVDHVRGKEKSFNQMSSVEMQPVTTRAGVTRITDTPLAKRWLRPFPYDLASLFDEWDEEFLGEIVLPKSTTMESHVYAYNRAVDRTVINAALGTNYVGETGVTPVTLPAGQQIAVNFVETGTVANSGLTIGKLRQAKFILDNAEVDDQETRVMIVCAKQLQDLLRTTEVTSSDYNTIKCLVEGTVNSYMGFTFKRISNKILPIDVPSDVRTCVAWAKSAMRLTDTGRETKMDIRADLSHALQIRTVAALGATRTEEEKVVSIACDESP